MRRGRADSQQQRDTMQIVTTVRQLHHATQPNTSTTQSLIYLKLLRKPFNSICDERWSSLKQSTAIAADWSASTNGEHTVYRGVVSQGINSNAHITGCPSQSSHPFTSLVAQASLPIRSHHWLLKPVSQTVHITGCSSQSSHPVHITGCSSQSSHPFTSLVAQASLPSRSHHWLLKPVFPSVHITGCSSQSSKPFTSLVAQASLNALDNRAGHKEEYKAEQVGRLAKALRIGI